QKGDPGDPATNLVTSVNGEQGVVVLGADDVGADPAGSAASAQAAAATDATNKVSIHASDTTDVHGIPDTAQLVVTTDPRLTNSRPPTAHASSHASGGSDPVTPAAIGAYPAADGVALNGYVTDLQNRVGGTFGLENRTTAVEGRATTLETRATNLEGRATSLEGRATTLEGSVAGKLDKVGGTLTGSITVNAGTAGNAGTTPAFGSGVSGQVFDQFRTAIDGSQTYGIGTAARDTTWGRRGVAQIGTPDSDIIIGLAGKGLRVKEG
ncbi:hypothetical protein, partial [Streptomyces sp. WAC02707]|uniref:hypothetical protein n=1 Tax=Streptomyces sp. WAC02707 TaxID=2487417 RepID=UPI001C8EF499